MMISTRRLDGLATRLTGKRTRVAIGHEFPAGLVGQARWSEEHKCYELLLSPALFLNQRDPDLVDVFLHECAHIALGHVTTKSVAPRGAMLTPAQLASGYVQNRESAADELATHMAYETGLTTPALWQLMADDAGH